MVRLARYRTRSSISVLCYNSVMITKRSSNYRWLGLGGLLIMLVDQWIDAAFSTYLDLLARFLLLAFAYWYWKGHKDTFAIVLLITMSVIFVLSILTLTQLLITPGLL